MIDRVLCPRHLERTPSCVIYEESAYCYGGCGRIELSELGRQPLEASAPRPKTDLAGKRAYIATLPTRTIRGIELPYDDYGFYLCWSDSLYYKYRVFNPDSGPKYRNPTGHPQPLYWARRSLDAATLYITEGELNAISLCRAIPDADVCSPGSATDFVSNKRQRDLPTLTVYLNVVVVTDRDPPGVAAAIAMKSMLLGKVPNVTICLMNSDCNAVLCSEGPDGVIKAVKEGIV